MPSLKLYDRVVTLVPLKTEFEKRLLPVGTEAVVADLLGRGGAILEFSFPDLALHGGRRYDTAVAKPGQFKVES